jgi:RNA polymerase sigma-70 factor (ECF subfamily)
MRTASSLITTMADEDVVRRVLDGEVLLFEVVMRRNNQRLYRVTRAILGNDAEVEDVVQEAYLKAYEHLRQFAGKSAFSTWLISITINEARRCVLRRARFKPLSENNEVERRGIRLESSLNTEREASIGELRKILERVVDQLPQHLRTVFILRDVEQLSMAETAAVLNIREQTAKTRLHRARRRLRVLLSTHVGETVVHLFEFGRWRCDRIVAAVMKRLGSQPLTKEVTLRNL